MSRCHYCGRALNRYGDCGQPHETPIRLSKHRRRPWAVVTVQRDIQLRVALHLSTSGPPLTPAQRRRAAWAEAVAADGLFCGCEGREA